MSRGLIISLEGCDGVGKTTQCMAVSKAIDRSIVIAAPDRNSETGIVINRFLKGEITLTPIVSQYIFIANRWEAQSKILDAVNSGIDVILDRSIHSSLVYGMQKGLDYTTCCRLEYGLIYPDLCILLKRTVEGIEDEEIYNATDIQDSIFKEYLRYTDLVHVESSDIESTTMQILYVVRRYMQTTDMSVRFFTTGYRI